MMSYRQKYCLIFIVVISLFAISSCASTPAAYRHPELDLNIKDIKSFGLLPPGVNIYEFETDGTLKLVTEWSKKGRENISRTFIEFFNEKSVEIKLLKIENEDTDLVQAIQSRYLTVSADIDPKRKDSSYFIGSIEDVLKKYNIDALIFVYARDTISTAGRKAKGFMTRFYSIFVGNLTGTRAVNTEPREGMTVITIGLVDKSGSILWYRGIQSEGAFDLRDFESAAKITKINLSDFPGLGK
jgi:hypothetical protein